MTFDATPTANAITLPDATQQQTQQTQPPTDATGFPKGIVSVDPGPPTLGGKFERWARNLNEDLRDGTDLTGIGTVLKKMGAHGLGDNPVGDFMGSIQLGLAKALIGASELSQGKVWPGMRDTASGVLGVGTIPLSFAGPEGGVAGEAFDTAAGKAGQAYDAVAEQAGRAANAVKAPFSVHALQQPLQQGIRDVFATVAKDAGVTPSASASIRDVATELSSAVKAKASALYSQLDAATGGGRFQRFQDALSNIEDGLRDSLGVDPEKYEALLERKAEVQAAQQAALDMAKAKGVDPALISKANATWTQQAALDDLGKAVRQTVSGMRPELAEAKSSMERVNPKTLFAKINRLNDRGRLAQAIGPENAQALLQHVDSAWLTAEKLANRQKWIGKAAKTVGLGGVGALGYEAVSGLHHMLSADGQ